MIPHAHTAPGGDCKRSGTGGPAFDMLGDTEIVALNRYTGEGYKALNEAIRDNAMTPEPQRGEQDVLFPSFRGKRLTIHGVQHLLKKHQATAAKSCPSLKDRRVTVHVLRHTAAMDMLQQDIDRSVIAMWLGHESFESTRAYVDATLAMKEQALARTTPHEGKPGRYKAEDRLLAFLDSL